MNYFLTYVGALTSLAVLDAFWILVFAKKFYAEHMGFLFSKSIQLIPVAFFYPLYAFAIVLLAAWPAVVSGSWSEALWRGAILGLAAYGAYDLTNHATIAEWPLVMTLVDMAWGIVVTAIASFAAYALVTSVK